MDEQNKLAELATKLRIGSYHRHVFLCIGEQCCTKEVGDAAWNTLKSELAKKGLTLERTITPSTGPKLAAYASARMDRSV